MNKTNLTLLVLKDFDPERVEKTMIPENLEMVSINPKHIIVATSDGIKGEDGTIQIMAHIQGEDYETLSRMFMLLASKTHQMFIENIEKNKQNEEKE
jgi:hypothetical protein